MVTVNGTVKVGKWSHGQEIDETFLSEDMGVSGNALYVSVVDDFFLKRAVPSHSAYGAVCQDMAIGW